MLLEILVLLSCWFDFILLIMKRLLFFVFLFVFVIVSACSQKQAENNESDRVEPVVVAYITSWSSDTPDPTYITHFNYAFGHVNETFNGVRIDNEDRFRLVIGLKEEKPELKVLLSIGGWTSGGFSEMAADEVNRKAFAIDCQRVIMQYGLDGIDLNWEYPTHDRAGITASPDDTDNYTLLVRDIRKEIGNNKLLTMASDYTGDYFDFKTLEPLLDYVSIMNYDTGEPPYHNAGLYHSEHTQDLSVDESVDEHIRLGLPPHKLVLGIPFGGKGLRGVRFSNAHLQEGYTQEWDDVAKAAYLADADGNFVHTYEEPRAIALKCAYLHSKGLLGAMYWSYSGDDTGILRKAVFDGVIEGR